MLKKGYLIEKCMGVVLEVSSLLVINRSNSLSQTNSTILSLLLEGFPYEMFDFLIPKGLFIY